MLASQEYHQICSELGDATLHWMVFGAFQSFIIVRVVD
jgi:hypothetical protein